MPSGSWPRRSSMRRTQAAGSRCASSMTTILGSPRGERRASLSTLCRWRASREPPALSQSASCPGVECCSQPATPSVLPAPAGATTIVTAPLTLLFNRLQSSRRGR